MLPEALPEIFGTASIIGAIGAFQYVNIGARYSRLKLGNFAEFVLSNLSLSKIHLPSMRTSTFVPQVSVLTQGLWSLERIIYYLNIAIVNAFRYLHQIGVPI